MRHTLNAHRVPGLPAIVLAALALTPGAAELAAQAAEGDTVRISTAWGRSVYQLRAIRGDTVVVEEDDAIFGIPRSHIDRIEVGTRRGPEQVVYGALIGAGIGAAAGAVLGFGLGTSCESGELGCVPAGEAAAAGGLVLGAVGGIAGLAAGALAPWSWKRVDAEELAIGAAPGPDGLSLQVSFRPGR